MSGTHASAAGATASSTLATLAADAQLLLPARTRQIMDFLENPHA
ncbi:hypothetical protein [Nonomuraea sp. NPDC049709]